MGSQSEQIQDLYDYVICGMPSLRTRSPYKALIGVLRGGTAGCVLAGRLAENPELSILLVEAGPPIEAVPASAMPAAFVFPKNCPQRRSRR